MSTRPSTRPLTAALSTIPDTAWTPPSNYADNRVHHLYQRCDLVNAGEWRPWAGPFHATLADFERDQGGTVHDAWLSRIQPGGYIVPHTDRSRWRERWHIPIQVAGYMIAATDYGQSLLGTSPAPFRVEHWLPHSVRNDDDQDRIHLVIDLDRYVGPDETRPFVIL